MHKICLKLSNELVMNETGNWKVLVKYWFDCMEDVTAVHRASFRWWITGSLWWTLFQSLLADWLTECVNGWMYRWMDKWMGGWMDEWIDRWTNEWVAEHIIRGLVLNKLFCVYVRPAHKLMTDRMNRDIMNEKNGRIYTLFKTQIWDLSKSW